MSIACPYCKAVLTPKGLRPGKHTPKCPKCGKPFILSVPEDEAGTILVQPMGPKPLADTVRTPAKKPSAAPVPPPPPKKPMSLEDAAAALLEGKDPGDITDFESPPDPNATGAFTEPEATTPPKAPEKPLPKTVRVPEGKFATKPPPKAAPKPALHPDPNVTGDFSEKDAPPPAEKSKAAVKPALRLDPNATGDFTEPNATGDFTEPAASVADKPAKDPTDLDADALPQPPRKQEDPTDEMPALALGATSSKPRKTVKDETAAETEDLPPRLGGYEVLKLLGKGGMGAVLLGRQISLDRPVALKVMHPKIAQNPTSVARFTREAYAAAQLTHHNVIQVYDIGEDRGQHFFSMEFVKGQSLMELVKAEGKLPAEMAVGYILQAARGLRYGHTQGMIHRDIKPDNLMLNTEGIVKVADLGLVKLPVELGAEDEETVPDDQPDIPDAAGLTRTGTVMGTPAYMSPEQSRDSAAVDARADIYSLGCSLYVLVTGKPPFEGKTALEIISKHQTEPMTPPEVVVKRIPKALSTIVLKMTAKKPEDRYQSMDEVIAALEGFLGLEKSGTFNPKEEHADQLERCCHQFNHRSKAGLKKALTLGFFLLCLLGIVGGAFAGMPALAGGFVGLMLMTPLAYFVIHGTLTGSVVFSKAREVVFGMRFFDWVVWAGGGLLFLATLFLFGLLWSWIGFALLAVALGFVLWFLTDRSAEKGQAVPLHEARALFKSLRLSGLDEEQLRRFVCKFGGPNWEPFYEAVFGYEAKIAARAYRKGDTGEVWKKAGTWREPVLAWLESRLEARRLARERRLLQKVEARALEAEGVSKAEAKAQAEARAAELVDQAAEVKQARREGKEASVKQMAESVRGTRRPEPGKNIAGKPLRSRWLKYFLNDWFGRRLRFVLGALVFAVGLYWMYQNDLFGKSNNVVQQAMAADFAGAWKSLQNATGKFTLPDFLPIPADLTKALATVNTPVLGVLLMLSGLLHFGWRPTLAAVPGLVIGIAGPMLGVPAVEPLTAEMLSLIAGAVLILVVGWLLRE